MIKGHIVDILKLLITCKLKLTSHPHCGQRQAILLFPWTKFTFFSQWLNHLAVSCASFMHIEDITVNMSLCSALLSAPVQVVLRLSQVWLVWGRTLTRNCSQLTVSCTGMFHCSSSSITDTIINFHTAWTWSAVYCKCANGMMHSHRRNIDSAKRLLRDENSSEFRECIFFSFHGDLPSR